MSLTNSPADYVPQAILRARAEADTDAMAEPVEQALRAIPDAYMTPEVALRIVECLANRMAKSAWKHPMDEIITALSDGVEYPLWALVKRLENQE
jgi:hypothetical protein